MRMNFTVDWIEFTYLVPSDDNFTLFQNFLEDFPEFEFLYEQNELKLLDRGMHGYTHCLQYTDDFMIWYNPAHEEMGVHVVFPGHGMYKLCEIFKIGKLEKFVDAKSFFQILKDRHCKITRLDIAYDDMEKVLSPHDYGRFMMNGQIRTKAITWNFVSSRQQEGGTFYLGKRGGERYIRIYDKDFESQGKINSVRYEFELRKAWAKKIFDMVLNDQKFSFADLLKDYMEVVEEYNLIGSDKTVTQRKYRASTESRWLKFLELCDKLLFCA